MHDELKRIGYKFYQLVCATALAFFGIAVLFYMFPLGLASVDLMAVSISLFDGSVELQTMHLNVVIALLQLVAIFIIFALGLLRIPSMLKEFISA
jgi:hypothetical protein